MGHTKCEKIYFLYRFFPVSYFLFVLCINFIYYFVVNGHWLAINKADIWRRSDLTELQGEGQSYGTLLLASWDCSSVHYNLRHPRKSYRESTLEEFTEIIQLRKKAPRRKLCRNDGLVTRPQAGIFLRLSSRHTTNVGEVAISWARPAIMWR